MKSVTDEITLLKDEVPTTVNCKQVYNILKLTGKDKYEFT